MASADDTRALAEGFSQRRIAMQQCLADPHQSASSHFRRAVANVGVALSREGEVLALLHAGTAKQPPRWPAHVAPDPEPIYGQPRARVRSGRWRLR